MSVRVKYYEWESAEQCLAWLFENHKDMKTYGSIHVWQESFATIGDPTLSGSYKPLTPQMLEDRIYSVYFCDDSVAIRYHDQVFAPEVPNRSFPSQTRYVLLRITLPSN